MGSLLFDLRHGFRALVKAPAFTVVTILTLALGIGANSAIFTLVNAALVRPLGFADPERLILIYESIPRSGRDRFDVSPADYLDLLQYQQSLSSLARIERQPSNSRGRTAGTGRCCRDHLVAFDVLGVKAGRGPDVSRGEDQTRPTSRSSATVWRRAASPDVRRLDRRSTIDRRPVTVVGVMPAGFEFPRRGASSNATPARCLDAAGVHAGGAARARSMYRPQRHRTAPRWTPPAQAAAEVAALAQRIRDNYPAGLGNALQVTIGAIPLTQDLSGQVRRPLLILLGAVGLVLLVTCANVANLILSRSLARQRDIGVRAALGAGRLRLFQVLLSEALILATLGGAFGLVLGYWSSRAIPAMPPEPSGINTISLDWRVVAFTAALALGSAALFALVPLAAGLRRDLHDLLREGSTRATGGRRQHRVHGDAGRHERRVRVHPAGLCRTFRPQLQASRHGRIGRRDDERVEREGAAAAHRLQRGCADAMVLSHHRRAAACSARRPCRSVASDLPLEPMASGARPPSRTRPGPE